MDIQFASTPPKKNKKDNDTYLSPEKKTPKVFQNSKQKHTFSKKQNPESKHLKSLNKRMQYCEVSPFQLTRLQTDYRFIHSLGKGNFSTVGLYESRLTNQEYAIKATKVNNMSINEVQALGTLTLMADQSKNIIRYYHSWIEEQTLYLVMQYCNQSLQKIIQRHRVEYKPIPQNQIKLFLQQALSGLACLHRHQIVHLDIKPDNLLFKEGKLKISDLGLCRATRLNKTNYVDEGDSRYLAKEVLNYSKQIDLKKADIFSLGMTIFQALTLQYLPNNGEHWHEIRQNKYSITQRMDLTDYSNILLSIVESMIQKDWEYRPSAQQLLKSKYFQDGVKRKKNGFLSEQTKSNKKKDSSL